MTNEEHKQRHVELHKKFDELLADFIGHTGRLPSETNLIEFMNWSYRQTLDPTEEAVSAKNLMSYQRTVQGLTPIPGTDHFEEVW